MRTDYVPGNGLAIVVDGTATLLPDGCSTVLLEELWASMQTGAGLTDHLQVLLGRGLAAAPSFAMVEVVDGAAHVVVRGSARVEVFAADQTRVVGAAHVSTWAEETVVAAQRIRLAGSMVSAATVALPVLAAVVPAAEVRLSVASPAAAAEAEPMVEHAVEPQVVEPMAVETPVGQPVVAPFAEPVPARPAHAEPDGQDPAEVLHAVPAWEPVRAIPATQLAGPGRLPAVPAPVRVPTEPAGVRVPEDHDGLTVLSSDVVALRRQLPDWAGDAVPQLAVPNPRSKAPAKLLMSTGLVVSLNRSVLIGRAPQVTRVANNEIPRLITVASPNQDISRTHCEVRMDGDDVVITDLRSTNGVLLLRQGQGAQRLHPGEPTVVEPGVVVDLGEGVTFLVEAGG